jgi:hypothetical protein
VLDDVAKTPSAGTEAAVWNGGYEMTIDFEINQPGGGRVHRPYVAVWVEDAAGFPVRTLVLWVQASGPGPRWIPDLRRWYRSDQVRKVIDDRDLVATVSGPTRKPGAYSVAWDGKDADGKLVPPGDYVIHIEAAREHGTYQLLRHKMTLAVQPQTKVLDGNVEIKSAKLDYHAIPQAAKK